MLEKEEFAREPALHGRKASEAQWLWAVTAIVGFCPHSEALPCPAHKRGTFWY